MVCVTKNRTQLKRLSTSIRSVVVVMSVPSGSNGKESTCNVGDLDWEDPLEEGMATFCIILTWRIPMDKGA